MLGVPTVRLSTCLSLVLDQREKRAREREEDGTPGGSKARKRMRPSVNV